VYVCQSGPVFNYAQLESFKGEAHEKAA
jgi:hypothetical protein